MENLDTHEARLTIDIDPAMIEQTRKEVAKNLSKSVRVPGFRPGMASMNVVMNAIGGEAVFAEEVNDTRSLARLPQALDEAKVNPYTAGVIEAIKQDPPQMIARVPLEPKVDLKDYKSTRVAYPEVSVTSNEIERELERIRRGKRGDSVSRPPGANGRCG